MGEHMADEYFARWIVDPNNEPILVPLDVEHGASASGVGAGPGFPDCHQVLPVGFPRDPEPCIQ